MGRAIDKASWARPGEAISPERQSAWMSKITNDGLTLYDT